MKISEVKNLVTAETPVIGERYTLSGCTLIDAEDKLNGGTRKVAILITDKGAIFAPSSFTRAILESMEEGEDVEKELNGHTIEIKEVKNKKYGGKMKVVNFIS